MNAQVQVAPVPVYEYRIFSIGQLGALEAELNKAAAEGWFLGTEIIGLNAVMLIRQKAVRLVPVEEPTILGANGQFKLVHPGNGRS